MSLKKNIAMLLRSARNRIGFLRGHAFFILVWPLAAFLTGLIGWSILLADLEENRQELEQASLSQAAALSRGYAEQLERMLDSTNRILLHVKYAWHLSGRRLKLENMEPGMFPPTDLFFVAIIDRNGMLLTSTIDGNEKISVADRTYFSAHQENPADFLYIGTPPTARSRNSNVIQFSRKLSIGDNRFEGVVLASSSPEYLTETYDDSSLGENGFLGVISSDNTIRVSRTGKRIHSPTDPGLATLPKFSTSGGSQLMSGEEWFADGRSRYVGWQSVQNYPIIALTGLDVQDTLAPLMARQATSRQLATGATIALGIFTLIAMLFAARLSWRKHQLKNMQATYRKATEEGSEGFYIARPVHAADGAVIDYRIIDCNNYGAELFGFRREDLTGQRIANVGRSTVTQFMLDLLRRATETGHHDVEVQSPADATVMPEWLHFRAVQSGGDLAVTLRDISDAKAHLKELERRSNEDELTGLPNRHWIKNHLGDAIARAAQNSETLALLYVDLDGFKAVNDTMGHAAGDELLCAAARRLKLAVRPQDHVVRLGGDEFALILEHVGSAREVAPVAQRVLDAFKQSFRLAQGTHTVGASVGISVFPNDGRDAASLIRHADIAMYAVKTSGKSNFRFYDPGLYEALRERHQKEFELRQAIANDQFVMVYQPRVDMATGRTSSMESLVRWNHPTKGTLGPNEFIPLAEETGLIVGLGEIVIDKVIAQIAHWSKAGTPLVPVSINVSPRQFRETDVKGIFSAALVRHKVNPELVEIEVTESSMMGDSEELSTTLADIQKMGIKLLVDDFGTGYSSLSQLQRLDFDVLKVDRAFTSKIDCSAEGNVFFNAIITMAHALGMRVVAEGVENEEQVKILKRLRCDELQGFFISMPLPASDRQPVLPRRFFPSVA